MTDADAPRAGEQQQCAEHEQVLWRVQVRAPLADRRHVPGGIEPRREQTRCATISAGDQASEDGVHRTHRHDRQASRRECGRVADRGSQHGERDEQHRHARRVEQQDVAVGQLAVDERDGSAEVDAVVVGEVPIEPATDEDRTRTDEERDQPDAAEERRVASDVIRPTSQEAATRPRPGPRLSLDTLAHDSRPARWGSMRERRAWARRSGGRGGRRVRGVSGDGQSRPHPAGATSG